MWDDFRYGKIDTDAQVRLRTLADNAELIQRLVNALDGLVNDRGGIIVSMRQAHKALDAAEDAGYRPNHP